MSDFFYKCEILYHYFGLIRILPTNDTFFTSQFGLSVIKILYSKFNKMM